MVRTIPMKTMMRTDKEGIETKHEDKDNTNPPPSPRNPPFMHQHSPQFTPPPPTPYNPKQWLGDEDFCSQVGRSMFQSLTILGLGPGASETEIKVHYRQLARKYHPVKNNPVTTGLNAIEASTFFQHLNNAHEYLKDRA